MEWEDSPCDVCGGDQEGDGWGWECYGSGVRWRGDGPSEAEERDPRFDVGEEEGGGWAGGEWDEDEDGLSRGGLKKNGRFCHDTLIVGDVHISFKQFASSKE